MSDYGNRAIRLASAVIGVCCAWDAVYGGSGAVRKIAIFQRPNIRKAATHNIRGTTSPVQTFTRTGSSGSARYNRSSAGAPTQRTEGVTWDAGARRFEYRVVNEGTRCALRMSVQDASMPGPATTCTRVDVVNDGHWAEIRLTLPVRVAGTDAPQLLVKLYRSNWLDYELYAVDGGSCDQAFGFSCRDETTVRWVTGGGKLKRIITYDRFEPVPARLERRHRIGWPWEQVTEWHYEPDLARWTRLKSWWVRHRFDQSEPNRVIGAPADCSFRFAD